MRRLERAVAAGAEFAITRPVYDVERLEEFLGRVKDLGVPVIVGVRPLRSVLDADYTIHELGVPVPEEIEQRLSEGGGVAIAHEMVERARAIAAGVEWSGIELAEIH
jgi:5,10-methylenetetrahydrofolate reductase